MLSWFTTVTSLGVNRRVKRRSWLLGQLALLEELLFIAIKCLVGIVIDLHTEFGLDMSDLRDHLNKGIGTLGNKCELMFDYLLFCFFLVRLRLSIIWLQLFGKMLVEFTHLPFNILNKCLRHFSIEAALVGVDGGRVQLILHLFDGLLILIHFDFVADGVGQLWYLIKVNGLLAELERSLSYGVALHSHHR